MTSLSNINLAFYRDPIVYHGKSIFIGMFVSHFPKNTVVTDLHRTHFL